MSRLPVTLYVPGVPVPQGSKTARVYQGRAIMRDASPGLKPWRSAIATACHEAGLTGLRLNIPARVTLLFHLRRPDSHYAANGLRPSAPAFPWSKPDSDKLTRAVYDALCTDAQVLFDDARIVSGRQDKRWADQPGVTITIDEVKP